jgi:hypothetical protein
MNPAKISPAQLKKLQTLWGLLWKWYGSAPPKAAYDGMPSGEARLAWVAAAIGRSILSTSDLTRGEAETAIGELVKLLPAHLNKKKRRLGRRQAQELGTAGRAKNVSGSEQLAGPEEWRHIETLMEQLGWTRERLDGWLRSMHSPLRPRSQIRTLGDANRVRWGLKRILKRASVG